MCRFRPFRHLLEKLHSSQANLKSSKFDCFHHLLQSSLQIQHHNFKLYSLVFLFILLRCFLLKWIMTSHTEDILFFLLGLFSNFHFNVQSLKEELLLKKFFHVHHKINMKTVQHEEHLVSIRITSLTFKASSIGSLTLA